MGGGVIHLISEKACLTPLTPVSLLGRVLLQGSSAFSLTLSWELAGPAGCTCSLLQSSLLLGELLQAGPTPPGETCNFLVLCLQLVHLFSSQGDGVKAHFDFGFAPHLQSSIGMIKPTF